MTDFNYISKTATSDKGLNNADTAAFHYFNPNGLIAEHAAACDRVTVLVDAGRVNNGWHLAYGSLNSYHADEIRDLYNSRRVGSRLLELRLEGLRSQITKINDRVDERTLEIITEGSELRVAEREAHWENDDRTRAILDRAIK